MAMLTTNLIKEDLSIAYVMAVAGRNGFATQIRHRDSDSVDLMIINKGKPNPACTKIEGQINIQMKATVNWRDNADNTISYDLNKKNYNDLRETEIVVPRILVVLCLPNNEKDWLSISIDELTLKKCAFWFSLKNMPDSGNTSSVILRIPKANLFSQQTLLDLMIKMQKEEEL
ncbi:MAG: hypothetical protein COX07_03260 [Bacteroidetes bacterium CG23_combo_of_CG06-09_8_20_14_all_32_9]|nr:MAG: hypothetical protein COX07_03260 [Bacteroidetes bacterium CG23_combo_of_CG06-09_8_20_14_all_32_9]